MRAAVKDKMLAALLVVKKVEPMDLTVEMTVDLTVKRMVEKKAD